MLTRKQAAAHKRELRRAIAKDLKQKDRAKVRTLAEELRAARAKRDEALAHARDRCRDARLAVRARVAALREDARAKLREAVRLEREQARQTCALRKDEARRATLPALERAKKELDAERSYQEDLARIAAANRQRRAELPRASRTERHGESDDEVRANIPPELVPLFERVRRQIKGSARESRTEAFLKYAEEHPGELLSVLDDASDRLVRELEARQREERRAAKRAPATAKTPPRRTYTPEELAAVPF